jgi:hypothetical protein
LPYNLTRKQKGELPLSSPPKSLLNTTDNTMTSAAEHELKEAIQDTIVENAEITGYYNMFIQMVLKLNIADAIPF